MGSVNKEPESAPPQEQTKISFKLPDGKYELWIDATASGKSVAYEVGQANFPMPLARWTTADTKVRVSPAMVNDNVSEYDSLLQFDIVNNDASLVSFGGKAGQEDPALLWAAVYALWLHPQLREKDLVAIAVNSQLLGEYLRCTGLGVISPFSQNGSTTTVVPKDAIFWVHREAFWQGAGAPDSQNWIRSRPEVTQFPGFNGTNGSFPSQIGFTRKGNVCTVHPVRPPKPAPGTLIYSRYIVDLGEHLRIYHIDASNPVHFEAYARWQNSDRVNAGWRERGPDDHHRRYLASQLEDPHTMSCVFEWDGQLAGYTEIGFVMEDNVTCFIGSNCNIVVGEHDQNVHFLVGEERFRGGKRYQAANCSIMHFAFLRDPRTKQIIREPQHDQPNVKILERFAPLEKKKRFHLPHKTSMLVALQRDRFFQAGHFL
ncbi:Acyl-CoA N-acyltransferase [Metarhizium album ARSEF 1941]|uniref:Acyl-CoA N-acyltransferase n=1 Tax=Metarhizium album (strain ARSEF 1941) TaxID=1081103 RepID=A0A0B2WRQ5_METAS|nr:Acyl-CoA N-acyltransferase [Metarhizium album ARSEF 1941]KHN96182.1 Acyl-CoA N-acyltransferase [Metarhizium album ARSEF 1941]